MNQERIKGMQLYQLNQYQNYCEKHKVTVIEEGNIGTSNVMRQYGCNLFLITPLIS